jgi:alanine-glyoxylate transaminase / serine-glyoxylate transaminase / serine-pyruvate transaminase
MRSEAAMTPPYKLMIPGPVQPDDDVLAVMGQPVQAHYGPAWAELYHDTTRSLARVFGTAGDVHLLVGSGSAGLDACLGSAAATGQTVIVGVNGFFGQRLQAVAESYGLRVVVVGAPWGQPLNPADFDAALAQHPQAALVAVVHIETSTTVVNPIQAIGEIVRARGGFYLVDAVSSLGGVPLAMDAWHIDLCASASQKCLGAPPGLAPVAVGARGWEAIDRVPDKAHGWYLNLRVWRQYAVEWGDWHPFPVTLATNHVLALRASLRHLLEEGLDQRIARYRGLALRLRRGLRAIGLEPYTPDERLAPVVTAAYGPPGVPTGRLVGYLADAHRIRIAGGMGQLKDVVFRIGHMAPSLTEADIDDLVEKLGAFRG